MEVRRVKLNELSDALAVAWNVFMEFDAGDYGEEGIREFRRSISDPEYLGMLTIYGAFAGSKLVGMLATRKEGTHIALLFVERRYQHQGAGRKLVALALKECGADTLTVNSAPYAVEIYHRLGFITAGEETTENGIHSLPMIRKKNRGE